MHKLDTDKQIFFYEQEFYVLSNFSAFKVYYNGESYDTSEHCYHVQKFDPEAYPKIIEAIKNARSAHDAFKIAQFNKEYVRPDWDRMKIGIMIDILFCKVKQHEYVYKKLMETGNRELVEDSWRDDFWGWGPNRDGKTCWGSFGWRFGNPLGLMRKGNIGNKNEELLQSCF